MRISLDCKPKLLMACIHSQLVHDHHSEFGSVFDQGEDPQSFLICKDSDTFYFTVSTRTSTDRHHSGKRTIVSRGKGWKCTSCGTDILTKGYVIHYSQHLTERNCQHIRAAEAELKAYGIDVTSLETFRQQTEAEFVIASRNIDTKAVSYLAIMPPEWCRLIHETHEPFYFKGGSKLEAPKSSAQFLITKVNLSKVKPLYP